MDITLAMAKCFPFAFCTPLHTKHSCTPHVGPKFSKWTVLIGRFYLQDYPGPDSTSTKSLQGIAWQEAAAEQVRWVAWNTNVWRWHIIPPPNPGATSLPPTKARSLLNMSDASKHCLRLKSTGQFCAQSVLKSTTYHSAVHAVCIAHLTNFVSTTIQHSEFMTVLQMMSNKLMHEKGNTINDVKFLRISFTKTKKKGKNRSHQPWSPWWLISNYKLHTSIKSEQWLAETTCRSLLARM